MNQDSTLGTEIRTFSPEEVFRSISGDRRAGKVKRNGDRAWLEKESPAGKTYRIQVYGLIETGRYHPTSVFNTQMAKIRVARAKAKAAARQTDEENVRWPSQLRSFPHQGTTFVLHPTPRPSESGKTEAVRHRRHGDQFGHPFGRAYA